MAYREGFSGLQGLQRLTGPERKNLATKCPVVLLLLAGFFVKSKTVCNLMIAALNWRKWVFGHIHVA